MENEHSRDGFDPKTVSILIVDDEKSVLNYIAECLTAEGFSPDTAYSYRLAVSKLDEKQYDLLLTDINLPEGSGNDLLHYCKQNNLSTSIILITGSPGIEAAVSAVKEGAFDYISKPFSPQKLLDSVFNALRSIESKTQPVIQNKDMDGILPEDCRLIRTVGAGSMGTVLLVEKGGEEYAVKIMRREALNPLQQTRRKRFIREAEILSKTEHPNIVRIYDYGIVNDDVPYILMEFVHGKPLSSLIRSDTLTMDEKINVIRQIASALYCIHQKGIIHRDVKPANILMTEDKTAKLSDFGIARIEDSSLTLPIEFLGSPAYMSPEAFETEKKKDQRSDIFSLGIIFYELLTGLKPFNGSTITEIMHSIQDTAPIAPAKLNPEITPYIEDVLAKMLAKSQRDRFSSADKIVEVLDSKYDSGYGPLKEVTGKLLRSLLLRRQVWR